MRNSGLIVQSGASIQDTRITFDTDSTHGLYIKRIRANGLVANFAPTPVFRMGLFNPATSITTFLGPSDLSISTSAVEPDIIGVVTVNIVPINYTLISATITFTPTTEGYRVTGEVSNANVTYGVEWIEWPRLGCTPDSGVVANAWLAHGLTSGLTVINPHAVNFTPVLEGGTGGLTAPPSMQFSDYFDTSTKLHVYVATDDDLGLLKEWQCKGDGTNAVQAWRHHAVNPRKASNGTPGIQQTPYGVTISLFRGLTEDGRCGHYDAAIRYREWATAAARPWMSRGPWAAAASIPNRVKNSDFYYIVQAHVNGPGATFWTTMVEDARRVKNFLGASEMMMLWYGWGSNQGALISPPTFRPPEFVPLAQAADENTALGTAATESIHVSWYTIPGVWDTTLLKAGGALCAYDDFEGTSDYGAISAYMVKDHLGANPTINSLAGINLGVAALLANLKAILSDTHLYNATGVGAVAFGYYRQSVNKPRGWYYDLWGGGGYTLDFNPAVAANGNNAQHVANKNAINTHCRDAMRAIDASFYFTTENAEETMLHTVDVMHVYDWQLAGMANYSFPIVYSRYVPIYNLAITLNDQAFQGIPSSQYGFYLNWCVAEWHNTGGHICLTNGDRGNPMLIVPTDPPTIANAPLYVLLVGLKRLQDRLDANADLKRYMHKGVRMRPLPESWEGEYLESGLQMRSWIANFASAAINTKNLACSSVWSDPDSATKDIGIVLTSTYTADQTFNIYMHPQAYGFSPTAVKILYRNVDGVRTEVTRFTDVLDHDVTLAHDAVSMTCDLYEVALA